MVVTQYNVNLVLFLKITFVLKLLQEPLLQLHIQHQAIGHQLYHVQMECGH